MNFKEAATYIESLEQEFVKLRDDLSQAAVENAKTKCTAWGVQVDRRIRQRKRMPGELKRDAGLSPEEEIVRVMKNVFDRLQQEMSTRFSRLKDLNTKFGFLLDVKTLLSDTDEDAIRRDCTDFANFYDTASMATNFSPKLKIAECCSVTELKVNQKLLWLFLVLLCLLETTFSRICEFLYRFC